MNVNYYYRSHLGDMVGSLGYFSIAGKTDPLLYSPIPVNGSRSGSPNSSGFILEAELSALGKDQDFPSVHFL
jgi:hypothetical protein